MAIIQLTEEDIKEACVKLLNEKTNFSFGVVDAQHCYFELEDYYKEFNTLKFCYKEPE